jgi:hypothetical protein
MVILSWNAPYINFGNPQKTTGSHPPKPPKNRHQRPRFSKNNARRHRKDERVSVLTCCDRALRYWR